MYKNTHKKTISQNYKFLHSSLCAPTYLAGDNTLLSTSPLIILNVTQICKSYAKNSSFSITPKKSCPDCEVGFAIQAQGGSSSIPFKNPHCYAELFSGCAVVGRDFAHHITSSLSIKWSRIWL